MGGFTGAPSLATSGLIFILDAANYRSYSRSGTTCTDLIGKDNGTLSGVTFNREKGGVFIFDGTDDHIEFTNEMVDPNSDFTFLSWVNSNDISSTGTIVSDRANQGSLQIRFNGTSIQIVDSYKVDVGTFSNFTATSNVWYNIVVVRSSNTYSLYVNGIYKSNFTNSNVYDRGPKNVGTNYNLNEEFNGKIAIVKFYDSALPASKIFQKYQNLKRRFIRPIPPISQLPQGRGGDSPSPSYSVPTGYTLFLDVNNTGSYNGSGTVISDLSTGGNDLTLINSPTYVSSTPKHFSFDGTNDYGWLANLNYGSSNTISEMSVFAWIRTDRANSNSLNAYDNSNWAILDFDRSEVFNVYLNGHGQLSFSAAPSNRGGIGSGNFMDIVGVDQLNDNAWHLIGITYSVTDQEIVMYVDGAVDETFTANGSLNAMGINQSTRYGIVGDGSEASSENGSRNNVYYEGDIASILFYEDTALTAQQAADMWNGQKSTFGY